MNKWLRDNKTATPELLDFINLAVQKFSAWIEVLNSNGSVKIEADDLIAMALKVEHGSDAEVLVPSVATTVQQDDELAVFIEPEQVVIGDIRLNSTLFNISSEEAKQNALALHEQFADKGEFEKLVNHTTNRHAQIFARLDKAEREAREHLAHEVSAIQADRSRAMEKLNSEFIFIRETLSAINTELKLKREEK